MQPRPKLTDAEKLQLAEEMEILREWIDTYRPSDNEERTPLDCNPCLPNEHPGFYLDNFQWIACACSPPS